MPQDTKRGPDLLQKEAHEFVNNPRLQGFSEARHLAAAPVPVARSAAGRNRPIVNLARRLGQTNVLSRWSISRHVARLFVCQSSALGGRPAPRWRMTMSIPAATSQSEPRPRLEACEKVHCGRRRSPARTSGHRLTRCAARRWLTKRVYDKAIAAFSAAHDADPDNPGIYRCARHRLRAARARTTTRWPIITSLCRCVRISAMPTTTAAHFICARMRLQSALDDFNAALKYSPKLLFALHQPRARARPCNKRFRRARWPISPTPEQIDPDARQVRHQPVPHLYRDGQV